jgi:hypothetical protein
MATGPDPRFPAGNSPIRGRGWGRFHPHREVNGDKSSPVGSGGDGDDSPSPVPVPRVPDLIGLAQ